MPFFHSVNTSKFPTLYQALHWLLGALIWIRGDLFPQGADGLVGNTEKPSIPRQIWTSGTCNMEDASGTRSYGTELCPGKSRKALWCLIFSLKEGRRIPNKVENSIPRRGNRSFTSGRQNINTAFHSMLEIERENVSCNRLSEGGE